MDNKNKSTFTNSNLLHAAIWNNGYGPLLSQPNAVGFKTNALRYRQPSQNSALAAAQNFLVNSRLTRCNRENEYSIYSYLDDPGSSTTALAGNDDITQFPQITLPKSAPLDISLANALQKRRSMRHYSGEKCSLAFLATLARSACGITKQVELKLRDGSSISTGLRSVASGGALYPIELYAIALKVRKLKRGVYRYHQNSDKLLQLHNKNTVTNLLNTFSIPDTQINYNQANMLLMLVAHPWRSMRKYGALGLRHVLHEVGAISQNIHLTAIGLGLGSTDCSSVYEDEVNQILNFDGVHNTLLHTIVVGFPE